MSKKFLSWLVGGMMICTCEKGRAQFVSEFDQLTYVNREWRSQTDVDPQIKLNAAKSLTEQQLVQLHLSETEKLLRKRNVSNLPPALRKNRMKNLEVLHQYLSAGVFPSNYYHAGRQPYFIDDNNVYCAVGYLMKESGADDIARDIHRTQNYSFLIDIHHERLMDWVRQSGLTLDELALIQPSYGEWPAAIVEFHYNNTGTDQNEYIEVHQSNGGFSGMISFDLIKFYDGTSTLYKSLSIGQMQSFESGRFYYYLFPSNESFADDGKIEISGGGQLISVITYTSSSVQLHEVNPLPGLPADRTFGIGESEATSANLSLNFCDFYYSPSWSLNSMATTIGSLNSCLTLPVSLNNFSYAISDKKVALNWSTLSETNSKQFIIERSSNGMDFDAIGSVPAAGMSSAETQYAFTDYSPDFINYYRLKQTDIDGRSVNSRILYVKVEKASPLQLIQSMVTTDLTYQVSSIVKGSKLEVFDMTGRAVYRGATKSGIQHLNVSQLRPGKYLIRLLATNGQVYSHQFLKQ